MRTNKTILLRTFLDPIFLEEKPAAKVVSFAQHDTLSSFLIFIF